MLLTDKYVDKIYGIITCYDRMIIQGYIPNWSHADAMTTYMKLNGIRIFDYPDFSQPLTEQVRQNAEKIAQENGIEIEFIRKLHAFRKDDRIQKIIAETGKTEGLVHIFSAMECCNTYKPWHDKTTGKTFLKFDQSKCLHYYFYFIDRELGLCYLRVPTWPPFRLQFYMNGHNLLAHKLDKKQIAYRMQDNAFLEISDIETAQKLSDRINPEGLHKVLDAFARRYSPVPESLGLGYTWTVQQIECATDIMFRKQEYLEPIYDEIIRTAVFTVKPDNIATFLGQRITYNCTKEIGTNYNQRILGTRIKHHMGDVSIKMYDKFGFDMIFGRTAVGELLGLQNSSASKLRKSDHIDGKWPANPRQEDPAWISWAFWLPFEARPTDQVRRDWCEDSRRNPLKKSKERK